MDKYSSSDMSLVECEYYDPTTCTDTDPIADDGQTEALTAAQCKDRFEAILTQASDEIIKFRNLLRRLCKKLRKESDSETC